MLLYSRVQREFKYLIPKMDNETIETDFYELVLYFWWYIVNLKVKERLNIITCIRAECAQPSRALHLAHFLIISFVFQTEFPNNVDIDLDEILDIEDENQRKKFIRVSNLILNCIFRFSMCDGCSNFSIYFENEFLSLTFNKTFHKYNKIWNKHICHKYKFQIQYEIKYILVNSVIKHLFQGILNDSKSSKEIINVSTHTFDNYF